MRPLRIYIYILLMLVLGLSVTRLNSCYKTEIKDRAVDKDLNENLEAVKQAKSLIKPGDIVFRRGNDATSYMLTLLNRMDQSYSHCGIVMKEGDEWYIYHSIGGEDNPDEKLRKDSPDQWFSPANNLSFAIYRYDFDSNEISRLQSILEKYYGAGILFDMKFDLETKDRFYCTELVYNCLNEMKDLVDFIVPAERFGYQYIALDQIFLDPRIKKVWQNQFK